MAENTLVWCSDGRSRASAPVCGARRAKTDEGTQHHKATSLVYQLVTSFYAGYQLVRRYQLVTRLVFGLVTGI
jgi:hypothetical protein